MANGFITEPGKTKAVVSTFISDSIRVWNKSPLEIILSAKWTKREVKD